MRRSLSGLLVRSFGYQLKGLRFESCVCDVCADVLISLNIPKKKIVWDYSKWILNLGLVYRFGRGTLAFEKVDEDFNMIVMIVLHQLLMFLVFLFIFFNIFMWNFLILWS